MLPRTQLDRADVPALMVLGAALRADGAPSPALLRRVRGGIALWRAEPSRILLVTGGPGPDGGRSEGEAMAAETRRAGVPEAALRVERLARTTRENARLGLTLLRESGWRGDTVVVVSDAWHLPRARMVTAVIGRRMGLRLTVTGHAVRPARPGWRWRAGWLREALALPVDAVRVWFA